MINKHFQKISYGMSIILTTCALTGCGLGASPSQAGSTGGSTSSVQGTAGSSVTQNGTSSDAGGTKGSRDNSPKCLIPSADGTSTSSNDIALIDYSNSESGYVTVSYTGASSKVKLRITGPDAIVYTYDLNTAGYPEVFPLTSGNGSYSIAVYENIAGTEYSTGFYETIDVAISEDIIPFLYPNQYVNFDESSKVVAKASEVVYSANSDLDAVSLVYNYLIENITYDYDKASSAPTGYIPDVDAILASGTGICLDYASVMCSMLRSQGIPARLEIGYAADAYHAWLSVYIDDIGWINGIVEFFGDTWTLMDPTFGASTDDATLRKFIGDGTNYTLQKIY